MHCRQGIVIAVACIWMFFPLHAVWGQQGAEPGQGFNVLDALGGPKKGSSQQREKVTFKASFQLEEGSREGKLYVRATMAEDWHIYSLTQQPGGPLATELSIDMPATVMSVGTFQADDDPLVHYSEHFTVPLEEHRGTVRWTALLRLAPDADPQQLEIPVRVQGQVCQDEGSCNLFDYTVKATFDGFYDAQPSGTYRAPNSHAVLRGHIEPAVVKPGGSVKLVLTAAPDAKWHVYALESKEPEKSPYKPTLIALTKRAGWQAEATEVTSPPLAKRPFPNEPELYYHEEPVSWVIRLQVPPEAKPGEHQLAGLIGYMTCTDTACDMPTAARFEGSIEVGATTRPGHMPLHFSAADYRTVSTHPLLQETVAGPTPEVQPLSLTKLAWAIVFGLLGGLILNLMPCVLPVVGLKILSFANQAGQSRGQILALNAWFSIGLISVFLLLATLAAFLKLGWGEQFTLTWFKVAMTGLVFAMALSFLGVWDIPIPGFMGAGKSNELQAREGASGAFFKGVFSTVLATPCSGPFLGPIFGYTLSQPPYIIYLLFLSVGVGMALPYLVAGIFPGVVRLLPRPGQWMETFKQIMGFFLLGTVVYLFMTIKADYFIPTLTLLIGIWFACWWIGRVPVTASLDRKLAAWVGALGAATAVGFFAFTLLAPQDELLPWQPYSPRALAQAQEEGKTVMIDFTAEWCLTCKWNLKTAINTQAVQQVVQKNDVVPLLADWTDHSEEIKRKLAELDSASIPVLAIYPATNPDEPIVLRDVLTERTVVKALEQAGPSKAEEPAASAVTLRD